MEERPERFSIAGFEDERRKPRGEASWLPVEAGKSKETVSPWEPSQRNMSLLSP